MLKYWHDQILPNMPIKSIKQRHVPNPVQIKMMEIFSEMANHCIRIGLENNYRRKLNSWPFYEFQRQVEYKAKWEGMPVKFVDPKRTSKLCPICGGRLQEDMQNGRKLLCINCGKIMDRDVVASMNVAHKGWARFTHPGGLLDEAMKGNVVCGEYLKPLILRVDGSKLVAGTLNRS
ncbi:MAG: transposase [Candidatus Nitrosotenuis sp.]